MEMRKSYFFTSKPQLQTKLWGYGACAAAGNTPGFSALMKNAAQDFTLSHAFPHRLLQGSDVPADSPEMSLPMGAESAVSPESRLGLAGIERGSPSKCKILRRDSRLK